MAKERILVIGAGAIGGVTAAKLAEAGHEVVALDANEEHVANLRHPGLELDDLGSRRTIRLDAYAAVDELPGRFDYALMTLKAPQLGPALSALVADDRVDTYVSLGNGLVHDRIAEVVGADRLLIGTVEWGATNFGPGRLAQTTHGRIVIGEPDGPPLPRTSVLADILGSVAEVEVCPNMPSQVWSKLLVNATFSGLGAVTGLTYGRVVGEPLGRRVALALWTEGVRVARAIGVRLDLVRGIDPDDLTVDEPADHQRAEAALEAFIAQTAATKASMLQDLERGIPTEVDVINGGVVARGQRAGIETPLNATVVDIVHGYERGERLPSPAALAELDRHVG